MFSCWRHLLFQIFLCMCVCVFLCFCLIWRLIYEYALRGNYGAWSLELSSNRFDKLIVVGVWARAQTYTHTHTHILMHLQIWITGEPIGALSHSLYLFVCFCTRFGYGNLIHCLFLCFVSFEQRLALSSLWKYVYKWHKFIWIIPKIWKIYLQ